MVVAADVAAATSALSATMFRGTPGGSATTITDTAVRALDTVVKVIYFRLIYVVISGSVFYVAVFRPVDYKTVSFEVDALSMFGGVFAFALARFRLTELFERIAPGRREICFGRGFRLQIL